MKITDLYYKLGGKKNSFLQRKWSAYICKKNRKKQCVLLQKEGLSALMAMQKACDEAHVCFGLEFGTMLGAYREHGFIKFDNDIDLTMISTDCTRDFENILLKYGFYKKRAFYLETIDEKGRLTRKLTEIALSYNGLQVDIFFAFPITDSLRSIFVYCQPSIGNKMTVKEFLLPYDTNEQHKVNIKGVYFNVFSEPQHTLSSIYGDDFMTPKKNANATNNKRSIVKIHNIRQSFGIGYILE